MLRTATAIAVLGLLCGCDDDGIRAYRAPKQPPPPETAAAGEASVTWSLPTGWKSVPSDQPMRLATFKPDAGPEVILSAFPGDVGGLLANINRWRNQLGLPPIEESQLSQTVQTTTTEGVTISLTDLTAANGQQMLGAIIAPGDGKTWFVKATGDAASIATLKPSFTDFARSFRLQRAASAAPRPVTIQDRLAAWTPPAHWGRDTGASPMVAVAFDAPNADGGAKITVTMLRGDGGGTLLNINRWRDQLGLPPVARLDQQPVTDLGAGNFQVDLASADGAHRMLVAVVVSAGQSWFFKITGSPRGIDAERAHFDRLVRAVGLGEATP